MKKICYGIVLILASTLAACGGGGGGGGGSFYGGIWDFAGVKVIDDCNSGSATGFSSRLTVNQDQERVVVTENGVTYTGTTNENDGFTVTVTDTSSNGCVLGIGYDFRDASDGNADVITAAVAQCGNAQCTIAYGGNAIRTGRDAALPNSDTDLAAIADELANICASSGNAKSVTEEHDIETAVLEALQQLADK